MDLDNRYGMRDMHVELLRLLTEFDAVCKAHGIKYSLAFGSMLGAIREHGIIPWDDDVDVIIDRCNYQKLVHVMNSHSAFVLESGSVESLWVPRFRYKKKAHERFGYTLTVDLFVIDPVPGSRLLAKTKLYAVHALQGMIKPKLSLKKGNLLQKAASAVTFLIGRLIPLSLKFWLYNKVAAIGNERKAVRCACYMAEFIYTGREYAGRLLEDIAAMDFDGLMIPVSRHYDSYLTTLYGDYMTPPDNAHRIAKHSK